MIIKHEDLENKEFKNSIIKQIKNLLDEQKDGQSDDLKVFEIRFTIKELNSKN